MLGEKDGNLKMPRLVCCLLQSDWADQQQFGVLAHEHKVTSSCVFRDPCCGHEMAFQGLFCFLLLIKEAETQTHTYTGIVFNLA